jgi:aminomethyltransferase
VTDETALIALQGSQSKTIMSKLCDEDIDDISRFRFKDGIHIAGVKALISRTGYTGEDGFELYLNSSSAHELWDALRAEGGDEIMPCGLAARDSLRLEAGLLLNGADLDEQRCPLQTLIAWTVKEDKGDFIGKDAMNKKREEGFDELMVGFKLVDKGIPRAGYEIQIDSEEIGIVTSGGYSPTLDVGIGLAYVRSDYANMGQELDIIIRDNIVKSKVCDVPFI